VVSSLTKPRTLSKDYDTWEEAKKEVDGILRKREKTGYVMLND